MEGAPNTRNVLGQEVYGSAMPTVEGIRNVLHHVGCDPSASSGSQVRSKGKQQYFQLLTASREIHDRSKDTFGVKRLVDN